MNKGARVVIINKSKILLIHRLKKDKEYYVLPGGALEKGETPEDAAIREAKEETSFDIKLNKLLWNFMDEYSKTYVYYYLVTEFKGKLELGGPEAIIQSDDNQYILKWISLKRIPKLNFYPAELKEKIPKLKIE